MQIKGHDLKVIIDRRPIKNLYLRLINAQVLLVTCPLNTKDEMIYDLIRTKEEWIVKHIALIASTKKGFHDPIYYQGKEYKLTIKNGRAKVAVFDDEIVVYAKDADLAKARRIFYAWGAKVLQRSVDTFKDRYFSILKDYGYIKEPIIKYRLVKSRWGVCFSDKNTIELNELLIHYDKECLEAVFFHECVHLIIPNHSKRFYTILENHMPKYKEIHKRLR